MFLDNQKAPGVKRAMVLRDNYYHAFKPGLSFVFVFFGFCFSVKGCCFCVLRINTKANFSVSGMVKFVNRFCIKFLYKIYRVKTSKWAIFLNFWLIVICYRRHVMLQFG